MDFKEIQDILRMVSKTDLTEVEIEQKDFKLRIRRKLPENSVIYTQAQMPALPAPQPVQSAAPAPIVVESRPAAQPEPRPAADEAALYQVKSPMIGTLYRSSSPDAPQYVKVGDRVEKGQVLCIIEAMKLFNEIESEVAGKVVKIMVENAQPVEYDQPLFLIDTNA
ncbi:MAG: acetyl-CoA carboxylase biotin carboxyl carrier protein [Bacteroidia bacterium]|nr:acetyl-CoA carboxylase biotin carboxyl carrier protein [Bacteroidia bacterium]